MNPILDNQRFAESFRALSSVRLNPRRHASADAREHSSIAASHAVALASANGCSPQETLLLEALGLAHDLGKLTGSASPDRSVELLAGCGIDDPALVSLVKWHDTSLPWYQASSRGQGPSDKAWRRLSASVDLRLLALFMIADRADSPAGWRRNAPTLWFLGEIRRRGLVGDLTLDLSDHPSEVSAGGAVLRREKCGPEVLVIRVRSEGFELPKGGIEWDELPFETAERETHEEAAVCSPVRGGAELGHLDYRVGEGSGGHCKRARYFVLEPDGTVELGPLPGRTRERRWVGLDGVATLPLVNEGMRPLLVRALKACR